MTKLSRVILFVKDMDRMTAFYRDVIGLAPAAGAAEGFTPLDGEGCQLALHAIPAEYATGIELKVPPEPRTSTPMKVCFYSDNPLAVRDALLERGVVMREPSQFGDLVLCDGLDPEGNIFQFSNR